MDFKLTSQYSPTGDQPEAIRQLTNGIKNGDRAQVLLGVTEDERWFVNTIDHVCHSESFS